MCDSSRKGFLCRSLASIQAQQGVRVELIVVANGPKQENALASFIAARFSAKVVSLPEANVSKARYRGLLNSTGDFFCFLDDDDEFLPDTLQARVQLLLSDGGYDIAATNGYVRTSGDMVLIPEYVASRINKDPIGAFLLQNWFASPAAIFRSSSVQPDFFNLSYKYFEWSFLFFRLVSEKKKIVFVDTNTYRVYRDHPVSASRTPEYSLAESELLLAAKKLNLPKEVQARLHSKYLRSLNSRSNFHRVRGELREAWKVHIRCLLLGGFSYIPYTRFLLLPRRPSNAT